MTAEAVFSSGTETFVPPRSRLEALDALGTKIKESPMGPVELTREDQTLRIFTKYISPDPMMADFIPGPIWEKQVISIEQLDLKADHGVIVRLTGRSRGEVGVTPEGAILDIEEVEAREEATGRNIPRYIAYDFFVSGAEMTNGPAERQALLRSAEQRRAEGEASMMESIGEAFKAAMASAPNGEAPTLGQISRGQIQEALANMSPTERQAQLDMAEALADDLQPAAPAATKKEK